MFKSMASALGGATPKPKAPEPVSQNRGTVVNPSKPEVTEETEDSFIKSLNDALSYDGFDVVKVRTAALGIFNVKSIMMLLIAYIKLGNSIATKIQKNAVVDKAKAGEVLKLMKASGVQIKATGASQLSLPRLAIAFAGIVIHLRHKLKLPARVVTTSPPDYQDLCLNGYVNLFPTAEDFIVKFNWVLTQASNKKVKAGGAFVSEEDSKAKLEQFRAIAIAAQVLDPRGVKVLQSLSMGAPVSDTALLYGFTGGFTMSATVNEAGVAELKRKAAEKKIKDEEAAVVEDESTTEFPTTQLEEESTPLIILSTQTQSSVGSGQKVKLTQRPLEPPVVETEVTGGSEEDGEEEKQNLDDLSGI